METLCLYGHKYLVEYYYYIECNFLSIFRKEVSTTPISNKNTAKYAFHSQTHKVKYFIMQVDGMHVLHYME